MNESSAGNNVHWLLIQAAVQSKQSLTRLAESYDLTVMQMYTLCTMQPGEPIPMNTISCMLDCDASNVTGIADRLLNHGLIKREENPNDRRVKMITLTKKGETMRTAMFKELSRYGLLGVEALSRDEYKVLEELLQNILKQNRISE